MVCTYFSHHNFSIRHSPNRRVAENNGEVGTFTHRNSDSDSGFAYLDLAISGYLNHRKEKKGLVEHFESGFVVDSLQPLQFFACVEFGYHCLWSSTLKHIHVSVWNTTLAQFG